MAVAFRRVPRDVVTLDRDEARRGRASSVWDRDSKPFFRAKTPEEVEQTLQILRVASERKQEKELERNSAARSKLGTYTAPKLEDRARVYCDSKVCEQRYIRAAKSDFPAFGGRDEKYCGQVGTVIRLHEDFAVELRFGDGNTRYYMLCVLVQEAEEEDDAAQDVEPEAGAAGATVLQVLVRASANGNEWDQHELPREEGCTAQAVRVQQYRARLP
jgi:hypothetical protein